ncbi:hypothetical protein ACHAXM_009355 [Skeletonema potamos]
MIHRRHKGGPSSRKQHQSDSWLQQEEVTFPSQSQWQPLFSVKKKYQEQPGNFSTRPAIIIAALILLSYSFAQLYKPERNKVTTQLITNIPSYDYAHALALSELKSNVVLKRSGARRDYRFIAGEYWDTTWTRDTSFAAEQAASLLYPHVVRSSLLANVETVSIKVGSESEQRTVWLQDECAHFGKWPHLSDSIVGARGAWSYYRATADVDFLDQAYKVTKNTLFRAEQEALDKKLGLFKGCSSFMESCSAYPTKYCTKGDAPGDLVAQTKALSTNALYYSGYKIAAYMGRELGVEEGEYMTYWDNAEMLRRSIRRHLWLEDKGYYAYFMDENNALINQFEGLGEAFVLLDGIERNHARINGMFANITLGKYGLPCLWPKFDHDDADSSAKKDIFHYYHNGRVWPFLQGYYAVAAAKHARTDIVAHSLESLKELALKGQTFAEFYDDEDGTFPPNRRRQLWSSTGFLAMVYQGLFGISYEVDGLRFAPNKPGSVFSDDILLHGFKFRDMMLDIVVMGSGSKVTKFVVDGVEREKQNGSLFVESTLRGKHAVTIVVVEEEEVK